MTREDVEQWLMIPQRLRKEYEDLYAELVSMKENPIQAVQYDRIKTGKVYDLSDRVVKFDDKAVDTVEKYLELSRAWDDRFELLMDSHNPHTDILSKFYFSCYNREKIAREYGVTTRTVSRWITEGINAILADRVLTAKICGNKKNSVKRVENAI